MNLNHLSLCARSLLVALLGIVVLGCNQTEHAGAAGRGTVTYNSQPLTEGMVFFNPVGRGATSRGMLTSDGKFELMTGASMQGVGPGEYVVTIESWIVQPGDADATGKERPRGVSRIPRNYTEIDKSEFKATITEAGPNEFTFELQGEGEKP